jgi:hypothetical protein
LAKKCAVKGAGLQREQLPARELVRSTRLAIEAAVEATKLSEPSMERVIMGESDNGQRLVGLGLGVFYTVAV